MLPLLKRISFYALGFLILALIISGTLNLLKDKGPAVLTTNIDIVNKTIKDDATTEKSFSISPPAALLDTAERFADFVASLPSIANPSVTYVRIDPGMRKEEIAGIFENKLSLDEKEVGVFLATVLSSEKVKGDGYFYPGVYLLRKESDGEFLGKLMTNRFAREVIPRYATSTRKVVSLDTAVKIASIIEREARGKDDMRLVSGVIWNRLFKEMSLDMDATLQYAKGNADTGWWPKVVPKDKFIDSPYNTYANEGLPPTPISNPRLSTIEAALNPKKTDYLFYIHDKYGIFRGARTYKEHKQNIARYYGKN
ncbi:MAG: endolytic transglycosylase MltG [Patescibacteria group bacterium]